MHARSFTISTFLVTMLCCAFATAALAQDETEITPEQQRYQEFIQGLNWINGPADMAAGVYGTIHVPEERVGLERENARDLVEFYGNPRGTQLGLVADAELAWFIDFVFDEVGFVKDDEKDDIDADELLASLREGQESANVQRREMGLDTLELVGWAQAPRYDENLKALTWATKLRDSQGFESINHNMRLLGRRGVMVATLVCDPSVYAGAKPIAAEVVKDFRFKAGQRYADFRKGDKIAEYGLKGLILGGGLALAAKTGFLKKFWKLLVVAVAGVVGFIKKLFGKGGDKDDRSKRGRRTRAGNES